MQGSVVKTLSYSLDLTEFEIECRHVLFARCHFSINEGFLCSAWPVCLYCLCWNRSFCSIHTIKNYFNVGFYGRVPKRYAIVKWASATVRARVGGRTLWTPANVKRVRWNPALVVCRCVTVSFLGCQTGYFWESHTFIFISILTR